MKRLDLALVQTVSFFRCHNVVACEHFHIHFYTSYSPLTITSLALLAGDQIHRDNNVCLLPGLRMLNAGRH
jgi:hypothetical protein